jgi:putative endonuclease
MWRAGGLAGLLEDGGMTTDQRQATGEWGERVAQRYLEKRAGMRLLDRRWRHGHGELDLIMRQGGVMVFVEVRVRTAEDNPLAAYQSIGRSKWRVLRQTACAYLRACPWRPEAARFDVVGIRRRADGQFHDLEHWENVGTFGGRFRF